MIPSILTKIQETSNNKQKGLSLYSAQKMVSKLLNYDRLEKIEVSRRKYTPEELASALKVDLTELKPLIKKSTRFSLKKAGKIDLPLIKLYLNTKWDNRRS